MVKGPCLGEKCDFWARVKLRKQTVDEIVGEILSSMTPCADTSIADIEGALDSYWGDIGIKDMEAIRREEPGLYSKMKQVEAKVHSKLNSSSS